MKEPGAEVTPESKSGRESREETGTQETYGRPMCGVPADNLGGWAVYDPV